MSRQTPYMQRRGFGLSFRIAVPPDLRPIVGVREFVKTLPTQDRHAAAAIALSLAAQAKQLFIKLRGMKNPKTPKPDQNGFDYTFECDLDESGVPKRVKIQAEPHEQEAVNAAIRATFESSATSRQMVQTTTYITALEKPLTTIQAASALTFKTVVDDFLGKYKKRNKPAMLKKHQPVLVMLLDVVGDKPLRDIRQADINNFFDLLDKLPPKWNYECQKKGLTVRQLAELDHDVTLGPKSFDDTYIASVRPFLKAAKKDWQDQGFPLGLTTDGIEYLGDREEGEDKQRAFKEAELKRLFEGAELRGFAADPAQSHRYWLPHIGLFTGARVNEICQLNPQEDILQDTETGTWYFWITKETEGDARIRKSVKTDDARKVPIHKKLIELGFLKYAERLKSAGAKLLFPEWKPINRRASGEAEKWFRQFLRDANLRDETPKHNILGMHAFRHTLLTYGTIQKPPLSC